MAIASVNPSLAGAFQPRPCPRSRPGFTLIEVLVVVAIIGLLVAILIPSLSRAREQTKRSVCASNVHQQLMAVHMYAHDWKGRFPANATQFGATGGLYVDTVVANSFDPVTGKPRYDLRELMRKYVSKDFETFTCPSNGGPRFSDPEVTAYVQGGGFLGGQFHNFFNSTCVFKGTTATHPWEPWASKPEWRKGGDPARTAILQDAYWAGGNGATLADPEVSFYFNHAEGFTRSDIGYGRFYAFKVNRDRATCAGVNVGYQDGHAAWVKNLRTGAGPLPSWSLDMPAAESAMRQAGSIATSGVPLTVKGRMR